MSPEALVLDAKVRLLLEEPALLANYNVESWDQIPREEIDVLQLAALKQRFGELRLKFPINVVTPMR